MYHSVSGGYHDDISLARFRNQIKRLEAEYDIVDLTDVTETTARPRIALTFDDGTTDFYENVRPVLHEYDAPATVFVVSNALLDDQFTHDEHYDHEYMTEKQLAELADDKLVTIGNHSKSHPRLSELTGDKLVSEIAGSKEELEESLGIDVTRFCYPYGDHSREAVEIVRSTHDLAASIENEVHVDETSNPHRLPRINGASEPYELDWALTDCSAYVARMANTLFD
ncbi:polysaccharide deacetylase family protein [Natronorubrum bangense]|nr:polysaccharide deacetylase family protein [Natronorubrum bangense]